MPIHAPSHTHTGWGMQLWSSRHDAGHDVPFRHGMASNPRSHRGGTPGHKQRHSNIVDVSPGLCQNNNSTDGEEKNSIDMGPSFRLVLGKPVRAVEGLKPLAGHVKERRGRVGTADHVWGSHEIQGHGREMQLPWLRPARHPVCGERSIALDVEAMP